MKNRLQLFDFNQSPVRVIDQGGQPWFVAKDVCEVLEIANSRDAVADLDEDEVNSVAITDGNRGNPNRTVVSESGVYALIFKSRKAVAKAFRKWVTSEVLPTIRKTGGYSANGDRVQGVLEQMIVDVYEGKLSLEKAEAIAGLANQYRNGGRRRVAIDIESEEARDFKDLVAALWANHPGARKWVSREVTEVAYEEGLFSGDIRYGAGVAAWAGAGAAARFAQLCDRFNGGVFDGVRFEVYGKGRGRYFLLRKEK